MQSTQSQSQISNPARLLTRAEAAQFLSIAKRTLDKWACTGQFNLPYVKVGNSARYRREDLEAWIQSRTVGSTSEN